jgi:cytochrome c553
MKRTPPRGWLVVISLFGFAASADEPMRGNESVPAWLFPIPQSTTAPAKTWDDTTPVRIPGSEAQYTLARINNPFHAPDWHPTEHIQMPEIVAFGRSPTVIACAYCHTPTGQGRPENSALAGLSADYIRQQLKDFRSGARSIVGPAAYSPIRNMAAGARALTDADIDAAAEYYARQTLGLRVEVVQSERIPKVIRAGWVYAKDPAGGEELLGDRIIEMTPDFTRHERRDDRMQYVAYVPRGSIERGHGLAAERDESSRCATCHAADLRGGVQGPAIAGRSPTYLARQLFAFREHTRSGPNAELMQSVAAKLETVDIVALAAYVSSLPP